MHNKNYDLKHLELSYALPVPATGHYGHLRLKIKNSFA